MIQKTLTGKCIIAAAGMAVAAMGTASIAEAATPAADIRNEAPVRPANQAMTAPGQFILNADKDVELVRFAKPHDMMVCVPQNMDVANRPDLAGSVQYPVTINWDNDTGIVAPGNCLGFDASKVAVTASPDLPANGHTAGQIFLF